MIVSYDAGYGYIKSLTPKGDHLIFPSVVGEIPAHSSLDLFSNGTQQIEVAGHGWLVGDSALRQSMLTSDMQNTTWVLSPEWRAMLLYAISEMTEASRVDIELVTGLPFGDYKTLKEPLKESLLGVHKFKREKRNTQQVTFTRVDVLTQNFAPLFTHLDLRQDGCVGVLNIGSHTVEAATVLLSKNGRPEAIRTQCVSESKGTRTTLPLLRNILAQQKPGVRYNDYEIDKGLQGGMVDGVKLPVDSLLQSLQSLVSRNWSDFMIYPLNKLSHFIITGGGAELVGKKLQIEGPQVIVGGQWDICEGYKIARGMIK